MRSVIESEVERPYPSWLSSDDPSLSSSGSKLGREALSSMVSEGEESGVVGVKIMERSACAWYFVYRYVFPSCVNSTQSALKGSSGIGMVKPEGDSGSASTKLWLVFSNNQQEAQIPDVKRIYLCDAMILI